MDYNNLKTVKISNTANAKAIIDYFPRHCHDFDIKRTSLNQKELSIHAGALCLYASTLITKIYENSPENIKLESRNREIDVQNYIKTCGKFSQLTEEQIATKAHEMIMRDIRNCFAHGNFKISYNTDTKKIYFILSPQRKDISINTPIVISAQSLLDANKDFLAKTSFELLGLSQQEIASNVQNNLNQLLQTILLPSQLLKMVDNYFANSNTPKTPINEKRYLLVQYILQATQIVYEQDDYYHIFGKDSNIFERISLIRNSIAHGNFQFADLSQTINYTDRDRSLNETLQKSVISLLTANEIKELILKTLGNGHSPESVQELTDKLKECFDNLFGNDNELSEYDNIDL